MDADLGIAKFLFTLRKDNMHFETHNSIFQKLHHVVVWSANIFKINTLHLHKLFSTIPRYSTLNMTSTFAVCYFIMKMEILISLKHWKSIPAECSAKIQQIKIYNSHKKLL